MDIHITVVALTILEVTMAVLTAAASMEEDLMAEETMVTTEPNQSPEPTR